MKADSNIVQEWMTYAGVMKKTDGPHASQGHSYYVTVSITITILIKSKLKMGLDTCASYNIPKPKRRNFTKAGKGYEP